MSSTQQFNKDEEIEPALLEAEQALLRAEEEMLKEIGQQDVAEKMRLQERNIINFNAELIPLEEASSPVVQETNEEPEHAPANAKGQPNLEDLSFVRLIDPIHIPAYLVEQIKNRNFPLDKFYDYFKILCTYPTNDGPILNNTFFLYALTNVNLRQVKGFLAVLVDPLTNSLVITQFSIDKEYWNKGEAVNFMLSYVKQMRKDLSMDRIMWLTKNVKTCETLGFNRMRETLMCFEGE